MESVNQDLSEIRKQRKIYLDNYATPSKSVRHRKMHRERGVFWSTISRLLTLKVISIWTLFGTGVVVTFLMLAGGNEAKLESTQVTTDSILIKGQHNTATSTSELPAISDGVRVIDTQLPLAVGQRGQKAGAEERPRDTIATATTTTTATATATSAASLQKFAGAETGAPASTILGSDYVASNAAGIGRQDHVAIKQPAAGVDKEGRWALNLASVSSKAGADRIASKALSKGIKTEQQQVSVKGKRYWRVQITGFSTAAEAAAYADTAKESLGLKDVWITKR